MPDETIHCGDDLILRRWRPEEDLDELFRVIEESLDHLRPWMPWVADHCLEATTGYLARSERDWLSGDAHNYTITAHGRIVGSCAFFVRDAPEGREIGYWLHPAATGHGYATLATRALAEQALALPGVEYVEVVHDIANHASGAVPRRLGFTEHRRRPADQALAPAEEGIDVIWRLNSPVGRDEPAGSR